jgi:hypothetical protein
MKTAYSRLRLLRFFFVLPVLSLILGCPATKKETKKEREIPDAEAQAQKQKEILELFKDKGDSATLFEKGIQTKDDPAGRFVLLSMARDKAAEDFEYKRAFDAVDELAKSFDDVDALEMKKDVVAKMAKAAKSFDDYHDVTLHALNLIPLCVEADKYEAANALLELSEENRKKAANALPNAKLDDRDRKTAVESLKEMEGSVPAAKRKVQEVEKEFEEAKAARETLETKADDKDANLTWGKFLCTIKGNWDKGLPLLEKSGDKEWAPTAKKDLDKPSGGPEQVKLGDEWWEMAEREQGLARSQLKARAAFWYKKAENSVSGLTQERIRKSIREVEAKD